MAYPLGPDNNQSQGFDLFGKIVKPEELELVKKDTTYNETMYNTLAGEGKYPFSSYDQFQKETMDPEIWKKNKEEKLQRDIKEKKRLKYEYMKGQATMQHGDYYNTPEGQELKKKQAEVETSDDDLEKFKIEHTENYKPLVDEFEALDKDPANYEKNVQNFKAKLDSIYGKQSGLAFEKIAIHHVDNVEKSQRERNEDGTYKNPLYKNTSDEITQESALTQQKYLKRSFDEAQKFIQSPEGQDEVMRRVTSQVGDMVKQYKQNYAKLTPAQKISFEQAYNGAIQDELSAVHKEKYSQMMELSAKAVPEEVQQYVSTALKNIRDNAKNSTYEERQKNLELIENTAIGEIKDPELRKKLFSNPDALKEFRSDLRFYMHNNTDYFLDQNGWNPDIVKNNTRYYQDVILKAQTPTKQAMEDHYEQKDNLQKLIGNTVLSKTLANSKTTNEVLLEMLNSPLENWQSLEVDTSKAIDSKKDIRLVTQPTLKDNWNAIDISKKIKYDESLSFGENALANIWGIKKTKPFEWTDEKESRLDSLAKYAIGVEMYDKLIDQSIKMSNSIFATEDFKQQELKNQAIWNTQKAVAVNAKKQYDELLLERNKGIYEYDRLKRIAESNKPEGEKDGVIMRTLTSFAHSMGSVLQGTAEQSIALDNLLNKVGIKSSDSQRSNLRAWSQLGSEIARDLPIAESKKEEFISGLAPYIALAATTILTKNPTVAYASSGAFGYMGVGEATQSIEDYEKILAAE